MHFICPLCRSPLLPKDRSLACGNRHSFDYAKEGYVNLLPAHHKNSRTPGDAQKQLEARHRFLKAGHYLPLLSALAQRIPPATATFLDIGCGEGYFTDHITRHLSASAKVYGCDIAKTGIRLAARSHRGNYAVASNFFLPLADQSMEVISRINAPSDDLELLRVLTPKGRVIIVAPAEQHLINLRGRIYDHVRPHLQPPTPTGLRLTESSRVTFPLNLSAGVMTESLLTMTPFAWRLAKALAQDLIERGLSDQADFFIGVYQR